MAIAATFALGLTGACGGVSDDARQAGSPKDGRSTTSTSSSVAASTTVEVTAATSPPQDVTATTTAVPVGSAPLEAFEGSGVWIDVYEWSPSSTDGSPGE